MVSTWQDRGGQDGVRMRDMEDKGGTRKRGRAVRGRAGRGVRGENDREGRAEL
jgi:hypothetical protein